MVYIKYSAHAIDLGATEAESEKVNHAKHSQYLHEYYLMYLLYVPATLTFVVMDMLCSTA